MCLPSCHSDAGGTVYLGQLLNHMGRVGSPWLPPLVILGWMKLMVGLHKKSVCPLD